MSIESAKAFVERMKMDREFAKKINAFSRFEDVQDYVKAVGFDFSKEDLQEIQMEVAEDELNQVSGGLGYSPTDTCAAISSLGGR